MSSPDAPAHEYGSTPGSPLPAGVSEHRVRVGATEISYLTGGTGSGEPVLFLHGWPTWAEVWLPVSAILGEKHPWIAISLPGQGRSSIPPRMARTWGSLRAAVSGFVDGAAPERFVVVGTSMGGTLAIMLALERPQRVSKLVAIDAAGLTPKLPGRTARMHLPFLLSSYLGPPTPRRARRWLLRTVFHNSASATDAWVNATVAAWTPGDRRRSLRDYAYILGKKEGSVAAALSRISQPTLILSGREDVQFPWQVAEQATTRIRGAQFGAVEGAGHFPMVERPADTAELISRFLDSGVS